MSYEAQMNNMKSCAEFFHSIGYSGVGSQGIARCITAFEAGDGERAIREYQHTIGEAANFASAMTDLDRDKLPPEDMERDFNRVMGVMVTMALIMGGNAK